jgi:hypothetical protein
MIKHDNKEYAESLEEYYALCGNNELKENAQQALDNNVDLASRLGLSDEEYDALKQPIRVY